MLGALFDLEREKESYQSYQSYRSYRNHQNDLISNF